MTEKIINAIKTCTKNEAEITLDTNLSEDLGLDSVNTIMLICELESEFDITIEEGNFADITGLGFEEEGDLVGSWAFCMAIHAVITGIKLAANKPLGIGAVPFESSMPTLEPMQRLRLFFPELHRVGGSALINARVINIGLSAEGVGGWEGSGFVKQCFEGFGQLSSLQ